VPNEYERIRSVTFPPSTIDLADAEKLFVVGGVTAGLLKAGDNDAMTSYVPSTPSCADVKVNVFEKGLRLKFGKQPTVKQVSDAKVV
jgi:hypothetical protein